MLDIGCSWSITTFIVFRSHLGVSFEFFSCLFQPSSCLSDKEEDEIYGFAGYGVYGKQMRQRQQQQQRILLANQQATLNYQSCLSPRSAFFYEFPPTGMCIGLS